MKKQKVINVILLVLILVLLIAIVGGVVYLFKNTNTEDETNTNTITNSVAEVNLNVNKATNTVVNKNANNNVNTNLNTNTTTNTNLNQNTNLNVNTNRNTNTNLNTNSNSNINTNTNSTLHPVTIAGWQTVTREKNNFSMQIPASYWWVQYVGEGSQDYYFMYGFAPNEATIDKGATFPIELRVISKAGNLDLYNKVKNGEVAKIKIITEKDNRIYALYSNSSEYDSIRDKMITTFSFVE